MVQPTDTKPAEKPAPRRKPAKKPAPGPKPSKPPKAGPPPHVTDPFAPPRPAEPPTPRLRPDELADLGRKVGVEFKADPGNRELVGNLALANETGLRKFDPSGRLGLAYQVYCGMHGLPHEPWIPAAFPHHRLPAEVLSFWEGLIFGVAGSVDAVMIADHPAFSAAFVEAVVG